MKNNSLNSIIDDLKKENADLLSIIAKHVARIQKLEAVKNKSFNEGVEATRVLVWSKRFEEIKAYELVEELENIKK